MRVLLSKNGGILGDEVRKVDSIGDGFDPDNENQVALG